MKKLLSNVLLFVVFCTGFAVGAMLMLDMVKPGMCVFCSDMTLSIFSSFFVAGAFIYVIIKIVEYDRRKF